VEPNNTEKHKIFVAAYLKQKTEATPSQVKIHPGLHKFRAKYFQTLLDTTSQL